jgi:sortase (surface protein transpeptidase)
MLKQLLATRQRQVIAGVVALLVIAGAGGGVFALASGGGSDDRVQNVEVSTPTPTPRPTSTPTPPPTPSPTPEPTPPPYDGAIARLSMPRLGIDNYIEPVSVINNVMQAPSDGVYAIGWYPDYSKPGWGQNSVFSAHETWNHNQGPFYALHLAVPGDEIIVTMDNGIQYHYEVMTNIRYEEDTMPMGEVIWPSDRPEGEEWITLITCGGRIVYADNSGYGEYLDRDVVQARRTDQDATTAAASSSATPAAAASTR